MSPSGPGKHVPHVSHVENRPLEKRLPQYHTFTEDDESQTYEDKYINFLPKASNVLDLVEIFGFEWEVANFGEEVQ